MKYELCQNCGGIGKIPSASSLVELRTAAGHSQKQVALKMGFKPAYVCDLEKGRRGMTTRIANRYQKAVKALHKKKKATKCKQ